MSSILDLLNSDMGKTLINGASQKTGQDSEQTAGLLAQAMPLILGAMKKNASTEEGAQSLNNALNDPKHKEGNVLDMLGGIFGEGEGSPEQLEQEGAGILGHVLGDKQANVENALSKTSGMDQGKVSEIIKMAAPVLMGLLGKQKQQSSTESNGLADLLGGLQGGDSNSDSIITQLLDSDGDGSVIDDVANLLMGGDKDGKKGGLGGMLGGLFGK